MELEAPRESEVKAWLEQDEVVVHIQPPLIGLYGNSLIMRIVDVYE